MEKDLVYDPNGIMNNKDLSEMIVIGCSSEEASYMFKDAYKALEALEDDAYDYIAFFNKDGGEKLFELKRSDLVNYISNENEANNIENSKWTAVF